MGTRTTRSAHRSGHRLATIAAGIAGLALLVAACSTSGTGGGIYGGGGPVAPSAAAVIASAAASAAATVAAASPAASTGGGRYGGGTDEYGSPASPKPAASAGGALTVAVATGDLGSFLTGDGGRTLYVFKKDTPNTSACTKDCATNWPPLTVKDAAAITAGDGVTGKLTTFARADGSMQVAYDGAPLYYFAADQAAGDTNGQGVGGNWFVAAP